MKLEKHRNILEFSLMSLSRRKLRNLSTMIIFTLVVFIIASEVFLFNSLIVEAQYTLDDAPDVIVQKLIAGRQSPTPVSYKDEIMKIRGVSEVKERVWGYYFDQDTGATFTIIGVKIGEYPEFVDLMESGEFRLEDGVIIGSGIAKLKRINVGDKIMLVDSQGKFRKYTVNGIFSSRSELLTNDLILMDIDSARDLFGISKDYCTDLGVYIPNKAEIPLIILKISKKLPDTRILPKEAIKKSYENIYGWRSGLFLASMTGMLLAFFILSWDRASAIESEEKREIGILRALGWSITDIIEMKFWESLLISINSFIFGVIFAYIHVYIFNAKLLRNILVGWSVLYPEFKLLPVIDLSQLFLIMVITVIPYITATIVPSWKASVTDPDTVMRGGE